MMRILTVLGTRPEGIKLAPVIKEIERHPDSFISRICVTAQHRQMLDQVLALFAIRPDYDLDLMQPNQTLAALTARVITTLDPVMEQEQPDWVLVQGDTITVLATSLVSFYHHAKVGHVEAGLRTYDKWQPFPEEINRKVAGAVADMHFAPTSTARDNLIREGVNPDRVHVTGNPGIDALRLVSEMDYDPADGPLGAVPWDRRIVLVTAHRRENLGTPLVDICLALRDIALAHDDVQVVYPVHLNPAVQETVHSFLAGIPSVTLTEPLGYLPLTYLMKRAYLVVTDSGGIQEEAPGLGIPVLVLRNTTERPEAILAGQVRLVGTDRRIVFEQVDKLLRDPREYAKMKQTTNPYGDGYAAQRIVQHLLDYGGD